MKTTTRIILDKRRAKNDGTYPLALRLSTLHDTVTLHKDHLQVKIHRLRDTLYIQSKTLPDTIYKTHRIPIQVIRYVQPDKLDNFINKIPWIVIAFIILLGFIIFLFIRFRG